MSQKKEMKSKSKSKNEGKEVKEVKKVSSTLTLWISILLIAVVLASFFTYIYYMKVIYPKAYRYNGFDFYKGDLVWTTQIQVGDQLYIIPFYHHPKDLEDIPVEPLIEKKIQQLNASDRIFITLDPDLESKAVVAAVELSRITGSRYKIYNIQTHGALTRPSAKSKANAINPLVTCANADNQTVVVWLKLGDVNVVHSKGNCILLEGKSSEDLVRVTDRFVYRLLSVMPN
ncbi:MAG: hypothetical protein AABX70_01475 [Nanoarchaeota archaeon]